MADRYETRFDEMRKSGKKAFIPFTVLGWPDKQRSLAIIKSMIESGATALELGLAFSDPIADGPVIQKAAFETVSSHFSVSEALDLIREVRAIDGEIPIGLLVYYNMVLAQGVDTFYDKIAEAGVDGVLIADLPAEEADEISSAAAKNRIAPIFIVSPLTTKERLDVILNYAKGFIYAVSRLGVTGVEERYDTDLKQLIDLVKQKSNLPLCVGFGVSSPEKAQSIINLGADGVITGSKIIDLVSSANGKSGSSPGSAGFQPASLESFLESMVKAVS